MDTATIKENKLVNLVLSEFKASQSGKMVEFADFESVVNMLECIRGEKNYEWMSNVSLPELASIILTDASGWVGQYFPTRDFVEAKLDMAIPNGENITKAATRCINNTLNRRGLYYFAKYVRSRTINALAGHTYMLCEWQKDVRQIQTGTQHKLTPLNVDIYGKELIDENQQQPAYRVEQQPVYGKKILSDHFNCEVIDPRNVATDNRYTYSLQEKDWITIRYESTLEELKQQQDMLNLINLEQFDETVKSGDEETETGKQSYSKQEPRVVTSETPSRKLDIYLRMGKVWAIVKDRDDNGFATKIGYAYDDSGNLMESAELIDALVSVASTNNKQALIRFQPNPYRDASGKPYKPIIRGSCYIHPTKDTGLSDGKYGMKLQEVMDDTINMSIDRVKLATLPTFIGRKMALDDTSEFYIEPEHIIGVDDINNDLKELKISDDTQGALNQLNLLKSFAEQVMSVYPTTMGALPADSSTTATAVAGAENRTNLRSNYKSLTYEYTFLAELYWMILQMTYQFSEPETAIKIMGDVAEDFSPDEDYTYNPVSSNVEQQEGKWRKLQLIDQMMGRVANIPNPKTPALLNYMLSLAFAALDKEFPDYKKYLLDESAPMNPDGGQQTMGNQPANMPSQPTSNQSGNPMSMGEMGARNNMSMGQIS